MTNDTGHHGERRSRTAVLILGVLVLATETYFVAGRVVGLPRTRLQADSFLVDDLAKGHSVSQIMRIGAGGFNGIRLSASPLGATDSGAVILALYEGGRIEDEGRLVYRDVVPVRVVIREPTFAFRFPVIDDSAGGAYRLDIWMSEANPENGIGLWATPGRSSGGSMYINGRSAYASLVSETRATRATVWARLRHPLGGVSLIGLVLMAACAHGVFFMVLHALMTMPRSFADDSVT